MDMRNDYVSANERVTSKSTFCSIMAATIAILFSIWLFMNIIYMAMIIFVDG